MDCGIPPDAIQRYVDEQIFTLTGSNKPREVLSVLLTGSRGTGTYTSRSDVDIDVVCPRAVYDSVQQASVEEGRIRSIREAWYVLRDNDWQRYYGHEIGRPNFFLTPLDEVERDLREFRDVLIWIWTNAKIMHDPHNQFRQALGEFQGYPHDVLARKIKYRWMLAGYWDVEVFPYSHSRSDDLLSAATAIVNNVNELLRLFFLVEGKPFPYAEKLLHFAPSTTLGKRFLDLLRRVVDLAVGAEWGNRTAWERLDEAHRLLCRSDESPKCWLLEQACAEAMLAAGVEGEWVEADYGVNIGQLLSGELGPIP